MARNQKQGNEALNKLLSYSDESYWNTFARIVENSEYDKPEYSRKTSWKLKVHILECFLRLKCEAVFDTFRFLLDYHNPLLRGMYIEKLAAIGEAFSLQHIRTYLIDRDDDEDRRTILHGISLSTYGSVSDEYSQGVVDLLTHHLQQVEEKEKESILDLIREFSKETYDRLKPHLPPDVCPLESGDPYYTFGEIKPFWGDYGDVLINGISWIEDKKLGTEYIQLQRTGPFVPPITFPSIFDIVITDVLKRRLEESKLTGPSFKPVHKVKLVKINWHEWDRESRKPEKYPSQSEPENYILRRKNRPELHEIVGELWELCLPPKNELSTVDLFSIETPYRLEYVASRKAVRWLLDHVKDWISIAPFEVKT